MKYKQNAMKIQIKKQFILHVERLEMTTEQKLFMSQVLLDKSTFTGIYIQRKEHTHKWNSKGKGRQRNKKICDIFKNGTGATVQGTLGKEAQEGASRNF